MTPTSCARYEAARALGEVALSLREQLGEVDDSPVTPLEPSCVRRSTGDLRRSAFDDCSLPRMVVGPRLLVSLRDAREFADLERGASLGDAERGAQASCWPRFVAVGEVAESPGPDRG